MSTLILLISILVWIAFTLLNSQLSYVNAQYLVKINTTELNITNSTGAGTDNDNSTTSNTQTRSGQGEDDKGSIASEHEPKCKGSALCPDW